MQLAGVDDPELERLVGRAFELALTGDPPVREGETVEDARGALLARARRRYGLEDVPEAT